MRFLRAILAHWGITARHASLRGLLCAAGALVAVLVCWQVCGLGVAALKPVPSKPFVARIHSKISASRQFFNNSQP